jgi:hypothetical protein
MRTELKQFGLAGRVERVEMTMTEVSTRSYKRVNDGRNLPENSGNPSQTSPSTPLLCEALRFDSDGRLLEDIDFERLIEQEPYRYVYRYNQRGMLSERIGYKQDGSVEEKDEYIYSPEGKKVEERSYSSQGRLVSRTTFRDDENIASVEFYDEDGKVKPKQTHRYEYTRKDNILEQTYYPPQPSGGLVVGFSASADKQTPSTRSTSAAFRTLFVYDNAGRLREESHFLPGGSLLEKKIFDEHEVLRKKEWMVEGLTATISIFDEQGKEIESHTTAEKAFGGPRAVDHRTFFSYDAHGNVVSMVTKGPDGSLIYETTNEFEYDGEGNWVKKKETVLNNTWQSEPFPAASETTREYRRVVNYFPEE